MRVCFRLDLFQRIELVSFLLPYNILTSNPTEELPTYRRRSASCDENSVDKLILEILSWFLIQRHFNGFLV